jgi:biotin transport system substrate-specific component
LLGGFDMNKTMVKTIGKVKSDSLAKEILVIFAGFVTLAFLARVSLPVYPIPITLSTLGVYLVGSALGARRAVWAVVVYLIVGGFGAPIFSSCRFGWSFLTGMTGGYLIGYVFCAAFIGYFFDRGLDSLLKRIAVITGGFVILFTCALIWLGFFVPADKVLAYGLYPFIPGEIFKICLAATLVKPAGKFIKI